MANLAGLVQFQIPLPGYRHRIPEDTRQRREIEPGEGHLRDPKRANRMRIDGDGSARSILRKGPHHLFHQTAHARRVVGIAPARGEEVGIAGIGDQAGSPDREPFLQLWQEAARKLLIPSIDRALVSASPAVPLLQLLALEVDPIGAIRLRDEILIDLHAVAGSPNEPKLAHIALSERPMDPDMKS